MKSLNANQSYVLNKQFDYYNSLSDKKKKYFEHRVAGFIEKYEFIGKEEFIITDEVQVLIAATSVMLTFGLRNYLFSNFDKVIFYPSKYYSTIMKLITKENIIHECKLLCFHGKISKQVMK